MRDNVIAGSGCEPSAQRGAFPLISRQVYDLVYYRGQVAFDNLAAAIGGAVVDDNYLLFNTNVRLQQLVYRLQNGGLLVVGRNDNRKFHPPPFRISG